jgi:methylenetetrahydrofolate reductase (NADPH)
VARIADLLAAGRTVSFEFFPPKNDAEQALLVRTVRDLEPLAPSFVSVTYRGGRSSRRRTTELVTALLHLTALTPMAHLICTGHSRLELAEILVELRKAGIENLMALGGDPPSEPGAPPGELEHALELVQLARAIGGFSIGVAAHPAGHPRSASREEDRDRLAEKLEVADFAVTQFFFDLAEYLELVAALEARGIRKPVLPGIMPVTSPQSIPRMAAMGSPVPNWLAREIEAAETPEAARAAGIDGATALCAALLDAGAPGLHFYTLNRSTATREIHDRLGLASAGAGASAGPGTASGAGSGPSRATL